MAFETPEEVLRMCEVAYQETENPLFVWYAIANACNYYGPLPDWIMDYLKSSADCIYGNEERQEKGPAGIVNLAGPAEVFGKTCIPHGGTLPPSHPLMPGPTSKEAVKKLAAALGFTRSKPKKQGDDLLRGWSNAFEHWWQLGRARAVTHEAQRSSQPKQAYRDQEAGGFWGISRRTVEADRQRYQALQARGFWDRLRASRVPTAKD